MQEPSSTLRPLDPGDIAEFQRVVRKETGVELSEHDAWNRATELIALVRMLCGRIPEDRED